MRGGIFEFMGQEQCMRIVWVISAVAAMAGGCVSSGGRMQQMGGDLSGPAMPGGRLGYPLGKYVTIEGVRAEQGKVGVRTLLVDRINGQEVSPAIGVWIDNVAALPEGGRCVLNGYESGRMIGVPREVVEKEHLSYPQACWQFFRYFIVTSVVEPSGLRLN